MMDEEQLTGELPGAAVGPDGIPAGAAASEAVASDDEQAPPASPGAAPQARNFARSTAGVFVTRMAIFGLSLVSAFLLARLLGPAGSGEYSRAMQYGTMAYVIVQFGLPSAATFFAGRGFAIADIRRNSAILLVIVNAVVIVVGMLTIPLVQAGPMQGLAANLLVAAIVSIPFQFGTAVFGQILYGRHVFRSYNLVQVFQFVCSIVFVVLFVGLFHGGSLGAIVAYASYNAVGLVGVLWLVGRLRDDPSAARPRLRMGPFFKYGLHIYPSSIPTFLSYRADVILLGWMAVANAEIGLYAIAVRFAEMLFYIPDSISTVLYPTIAGSARVDADRRIVQITRLTLLATVCCGLALIPAAYIALWLVLPDFLTSMVPLVIILPGIVSLSLSKVLASYVSGLGHPLPVSGIAFVGMSVNLVANILLIPRFGISGAAASSLLSYSCHAALMLWLSSRYAGQPIRSFITPGRAEFAALLSVARRGVAAGRRRLRGAAAA